MTLLRRILAVSGIVLFAVCGGVVLLSNRPTFGWQALSVPTGSMRPGIPPGSVVLMHRVPASDLRVGDVVTYTNPLTMRSTITHRIIKLTTIESKVPAIITKGDANPSADPLAVEGLVKGKVVAHVPYLGSLMMWAKTWPGLIVLIYVPALYIMISETRRMADYLRRMQPYYLFGIDHYRSQPEFRPLRPIPAVLGLSTVVAILAIVGARPASAMLGSNMAALTSNVLTVVPPPPPSSSSAPKPAGSTTTTTTAATCTNNTNTQVQGLSTRLDSSGNASSYSNTNSGSAVTGSGINANSSNGNVMAQNGSGC